MAPQSSALSRAMDVRHDSQHAASCYLLELHVAQAVAAGDGKRQHHDAAQPSCRHDKVRDLWR